MLVGCTLPDGTTLRCRAEEGVGQTVFWLALSDGTVAAAAYAWDVRPGASPSLVRAVLLTEGRVQPLHAELQYAWPRLHGTLGLAQGFAVVDADLRSCKTVQAGAPDLARLVQGTGLRLEGAAVP